MYKIGDIIQGTVTGVQSYGVFVSLESGEQGLIHISECTHGYIQNVHHFIHVGQTIEAMVIDIDEYTKKISLSMRALEKIPLPKQIVRKRSKRRYAYTNQLGFETLRKQLPIWIEEAQELIHQNQENNK